MFADSVPVIGSYNGLNPSQPVKAGRMIPQVLPRWGRLCEGFDPTALPHFCFTTLSLLNGLRNKPNTGYAKHLPQLFAIHAKVLEPRLSTIGCTRGQGNEFPSKTPNLLNINNKDFIPNIKK